ncbi:MAG: YgeY family selenium metabolism-linked hydrolase [Calditrichia bacterium]|nr:YgeY family selenium metabolism-linked hydrolase [Calditrichia bacterium]
MKLNKDLIQNIEKKLDESQEELNQLIQKLIQIRSYSGEEKDIVEFIVKTMQDYGFEEAYSDKLGNAIGRIGNGPLKIIYDAHIDTVRVTESEKWEFPPFEGKIAGGKIYGRGAVDEKPAMAGYLIAGKILQSLKNDDDFPFTIYVVGSVQEEDFDGYPLHHVIVNEKIQPDAVLLGEPTDMKVYRGQRGRMEMKITTSGISAHGAHNEKGVNAIYKMNPIIDKIEEMNKNLPVVEPLGKGSITVSNITSKGPSMCSVPDFCQVHIDRRLTLGETQQSAIKELKTIFLQSYSDAEIEVPKYKGESWKGTKFEVDAYFPTWVMDEKDTLVQSGLDTLASIGLQSESGVWSFSTNGIASAGQLGIPTIGFAPGKEELAHSSKEEIDLKELKTATQFYALFPFHLIEKIN